MREPRNTDNAVFSELNIDTPHATGVLWNIPLHAIEDTGERVVDSTRLRLIEAAIQAIRIVTQINLDSPHGGINSDRDLDGNTIRNDWRRVMRRAVLDTTLG